MLFMSVTLEVLHELMSWLNEVARMNMYCMSVTCEVSHELMASVERGGVSGTCACIS